MFNCTFPLLSPIGCHSKKTIAKPEISNITTSLLQKKGGLFTKRTGVVNFTINCAPNL
jgi:hypothetical protein